ncbi:Os05g0449250 [Oryza sativa Japonica Group]|uniref:Os05g0449250 protein n=1 Tax=Oryza sativa subsp. japonica TaxID=39947 RepID=A0A0P0WN90_ORYSJ|nr:hypothetical protein EE612_029870 [Oryza sativa]BAS94312.1 Os05g0449250 [Oryza sativa Japonica Group]
MSETESLTSPTADAPSGRTVCFETTVTLVAGAFAQSVCVSGTTTVAGAAEAASTMVRMQEGSTSAAKTVSLSVQARGEGRAGVVEDCVGNYLVWADYIASGPWRGTKGSGFVSHNLR